MEYGTISVAITNYNYAKYVGRALESILSQSYKPYEVIIVDDASTDNSESIIEQFAEKHSSVNFIKNKSNLGPVPSAQKALQYVSGDYLFLAAADDYILPGFFEKSLKLLSQYPQAGFSCVDTIVQRENEDVNKTFSRNLSKIPCFIEPEELVKIMRNKILYISGFGSIFRRSALLETGIMPELKWSSDRIFSTVIALRFGLCYIPEPLAVFNSRADSYSAAGLRNYLECKKIIKKTLCLLKSSKYSDVLPKIKQGASLSSLGLPLLGVILEEKQHRDYLSFNLLRLILWDKFRMFIGKITPNFIKPSYRFMRDKMRRISPNY